MKQVKKLPEKGTMQKNWFQIKTKIGRYANASKTQRIGAFAVRSGIARFAPFG